MTLYREALPYLEQAQELGMKGDDLYNVLSRIYYVLGSQKFDELNNNINHK